MIIFFGMIVFDKNHKLYTSSKWIAAVHAVSFACRFRNGFACHAKLISMPSTYTHKPFFFSIFCTINESKFLSSFKITLEFYIFRWGLNLSFLPHFTWFSRTFRFAWELLQMHCNLIVNKLQILQLYQSFFFFIIIICIF